MITPAVTMGRHGLVDQKYVLKNIILFSCPKSRTFSLMISDIDSAMFGLNILNVGAMASNV